ncbi:Hypothetical predicted protein [Mytilus galloprovincialis]|uniref:Uncharacterized protein n=1 Tax=Mytilus galloprovincialis TaxID=29158 RepID=A0A8B6BV53_MYTGA|nr:Hypothetical predicted protein [Mytilus galloprovincialis]
MTTDFVPLDYTQKQMCFSIGSPDSLESIAEKWTPEVKCFCPNVPLILVGNEKDQRNDENIKRDLLKMKQEPVRPKDDRAMAKQIKVLYCFLECSTKTKEGVREVFETTTRAVLQARKRITVARCILL